MEGYDTSCTGTYTALPVFQKFFGKYYPNIDEYQIPAQWQSALGVAGTLGNLVGIVRLRLSFPWALLIRA